GYSGYSLLLAAEDDFATDVRRLQDRGLVIALIAASCFLPLVWFFGSQMSNSLKRLAAQAGGLRTLAAPDDTLITSRISESTSLVDLWRLPGTPSGPSRTSSRRISSKGSSMVPSLPNLAAHGRKSQFSLPMSRTLQPLPKPLIPTA